MAYFCDCLGVAWCYELPRIPVPRTRVNSRIGPFRCARSRRSLRHLRSVSYNGERREKDVSERDYLAKAEALRRLSEPEGDHQLHAALERMRVDHPHLWGVPHRL